MQSVTFDRILDLKKWLCGGRWGNSNPDCILGHVFVSVWNSWVVIVMWLWSWNTVEGGCFLLPTTSKWFIKDNKPKGCRYTCVSHTEITCGKMLIISKSSWRIYIVLFFQTLLLVWKCSGLQKVGQWEVGAFCGFLHRSHSAGGRTPGDQHQDQHGMLMACKTGFNAGKGNIKAKQRRCWHSHWEPRSREMKKTNLVKHLPCSDPDWICFPVY